MRCLHFDTFSGISGDMSVAALLHLGAPLEPLQTAMQSMDITAVQLSASAVRSHGIGALRFMVTTEADPQHHRSWREIRALLARAAMAAGARDRALAIFERLADAEAKVHGCSSDEVVFHEVGAVDSIADIVGCALLLEHLRPEIITASPPPLGHGLAHSHHGALPVPAPATLELLRGIPTRGLDLEAELTTPTGAAILVAQVNRFTSWPDMTVQGIGYGAGSRTLPDRPNLLRVIQGEAAARDTGEEVQVEANIDDLNPECFEHLMDLLFEAGAHDVWLQPVIMKKSRPAVVVSLLCGVANLEELEGILFRESTTIGIRRTAVTRRKLARRSERVETPYGSVRLKISGEGGEVWTVSPEYEDCRARARERRVPLKLVLEAARAAWEKGRG